MKVVIVGGCGNVGLSLGASLAILEYEVIVYDINSASVDLVNSGLNSITTVF